MNKSYLFCIVLLFLIGCTSVSHTSKSPQGWQLLDTGPFKISVPLNWKYQEPEGQEDSFVGQITGPKVELSFDCSERGYANSLISVADSDFKRHVIKIDTTNKYIIKTIRPKIAGKGMTGIYIHSRSSTFNFQMNGKYLSPQNEQLALKAFKTIIFK